MIKNRATAGAKACFSLHADRRWAMTGTPIQARGSSASAMANLRTSTATVAHAAPLP